MMIERPDPDATEPVPAVGAEEEEHDFNPVIDDEDGVIPGVVPPEGHDLADPDDPATPVHESSLDEWEEDIATDEPIDTQHTDGSTADPTTAQKQGLVYTPPTDPPVLPSDDPQGAEVAAGFAPSMEESNPDVAKLPDRVDNQDLDLIEDIDKALRLNSETNHLTDLVFTVVNGKVLLEGTVPSADDLGKAEAVIGDLDGVLDVVSQVEVAI